MHVNIENYVSVSGRVSREVFYVGTMSEEEVKNLPSAIMWEQGDNSIKTWYVVTLEDHERDEIRKRKS